MIDVYSWATPNGHKIHIMLEECGYRLHRDWKAIPIDIGKGDQFNSKFLKISPNNKIPAMIDSNVRMANQFIYSNPEQSFFIWQINLGVSYQNHFAENMRPWSG